MACQESEADLANPSVSSPLLAPVVQTYLPHNSFFGSPTLWTIIPAFAVRCHLSCHLTSIDISSYHHCSPRVRPDRFVEHPSYWLCYSQSSPSWSLVALSRSRRRPTKVNRHWQAKLLLLQKLRLHLSNGSLDLAGEALLAQG